MPDNEHVISDQPIFSVEEVEKNNERRKKLVDLIKSEEAILMAGAGSSGGIYPAWGKFVELLKQKAKEKDNDFDVDSNDFLHFADQVKICLGEDHYYAVIAETFRPKEQTHEQFHEILCRLPFRGFTTTNYDLVLESALNKIAPFPDYPLVFDGIAKNLINRFLLSLNNKNSSPKKVAHLHGKYDVKGSIVLSESEYSRKYGFSIIQQDESLYSKIKDGGIEKEEFEALFRSYGYDWPIGRKLIWSLLATRRLVFIGFSMSDPYFLKMFEQVRDDIAAYDSETHFLILRITKSNSHSTKEYALNLQRNYGIQTVFYEEEDGKYTGLADFIIALENEVNQTQVASNREIVEIAELPDEGDENLTNNLMNLSKTQD
ncbi:hypothetical protein BCY89_17400 [Sphingobacterium siyangense]|uniref:Uncharacterized protein n=1 Tax=Sphingobacterium siyangense TaxID=459529 RepID=A0A420FGD1_9SPHI|nr:SIR2 family protein [Sphingobacterium siyangense]RKF31925.1 hypothetical protein BCY89_17400 [Sphingobacterium siyangense]